MKNIKKEVKNYLLIKYAKNKLIQKSNLISEKISWIKRKHLSNTVYSHCAVLVEFLTSKECNFSFKNKKFIFDNILKYSLVKGENLIKANGQIKIIKPFLQLNSYIIYEEIINGITEKKSKKSIAFNIEKKLAEIQEKIDSESDAEQILIEKISA